MFLTPARPPRSLVWAALTLALMGAVAAVEPIDAQGREGGVVSVRIIGDAHLSGYDGKQVRSPLGFGLGVAGALSGERLRIGLDVDVLLGASVRADAPPFIETDRSGEVWWGSASLAWVLLPTCEAICVELSATGALSLHTYAFDRVIDDIVFRADDAGWWPAAGIGLEVWFPRWVPSVTFTIDDRITWVGDAPFGSSPIQTLLLGVGWTWKP